MKITNIDAIMARSLRSLAGFCMGEYGIFELEIILLQLLLIIEYLCTLQVFLVAKIIIYYLSDLNIFLPCNIIISMILNILRLWWDGRVGTKSLIHSIVLIILQNYLSLSKNVCCIIL